MTETNTTTERAGAAKVPVVAALLLAVLVLVVLCSYQLRLTDVAVVTTLGKPEVITQAGWHGRWPWPVQRVNRIDQRNQLFVGSLVETVTRDSISILVRAFATWRVDDPLLFFNSVGTIRDATPLLKSVIRSRQEAVIRSHTLDDFFGQNADSLQNLSVIEAELLAQLQEHARNTYGIFIEFVGISEISLHENNTASVFARMRQEQAQAVSAIRSEGERDANILRDNADSRRAALVAEAEAEAKRIRGAAMVTAAEQYSRFEKDVDFAIFLRKLDALEATTKTGTTVILDPQTPPYDLLRMNRTNATEATSE